jgi:hypothetical protein
MTVLAVAGPAAAVPDPIVEHAAMTRTARMVKVRSDVDMAKPPKMGVQDAFVTGATVTVSSGEDLSGPSNFLQRGLTLF